MDDSASLGPELHLDDYETYVDDTVAYRWSTFDTLSIAALARHDALVHADADAAASAEPGDDLERWALARALARLGEHAAWQAQIDAILGGALDHPALDYLELLAWLAERQQARAELERAETLIAQRAELLTRGDNIGDGARAIQTRLELIQRLLGDAGLEVVATTDAALGDDVETMVDVVEDLARCGERERASALLAALEARAGQGALRVDLALCREALGELPSSTG